MTKSIKRDVMRALKHDVAAMPEGTCAFYADAWLLEAFKTRAEASKWFQKKGLSTSDTADLVRDEKVIKKNINTRGLCVKKGKSKGTWFEPLQSLGAESKA